MVLDATAALDAFDLVPGAPVDERADARRPPVTRIARAVSGASHPRPGAARLGRAATGTVERLDRTAGPRGVVAGRPFPAGEPTGSAPGEVLAAVTDGLHEACDTAGRFLGLAAVAERRRELAAARGRAADEIVDGLERLGAAHSGRRAPEDDLTVLVVRPSG